VRPFPPAQRQLYRNLPSAIRPSYTHKTIPRHPTNRSGSRRRLAGPIRLVSLAGLVASRGDLFVGPDGAGRKFWTELAEGEIVEIDLKGRDDLTIRDDREVVPILQHQGKSWQSKPMLPLPKMGRKFSGESTLILQGMCRFSFIRGSMQGLTMASQYFSQNSLSAYAEGKISPVIHNQRRQAG
jgi:hypothetical protein